MTGGGGDQPPLPAVNGGEFLLSLLQKRNHHHPQSPEPPLRSGPTPITSQYKQSTQQHSLVLYPAVAAVGPTSGFPSSPWPSNCRDLLSTTAHPHWPHSLSPPFTSSFLEFPQYPVSQLPPNQFLGNQRLLTEDLHILGFAGNANYSINNLVQQKLQQQEQQNLLFGSLPNNSLQRPEGLLNGNLLDNSKLNSNKDRELRNLPSVNSNSSPSSFQHRNFDSREQDNRGRGRGRGGWGKQHHSGNYKSTPPPGFSSKHGGGGGGGNRDFGSNNSNRRGFDHNVDEEKRDHSELSDRTVHLNGENERFRRSLMEYGNGIGLSGQLDHPGPPAGRSNLHSVSASDIFEESPLDFLSEVLDEEDGEKYGREDKTRRESGSVGREMDDFGKELVESLLLEDEADEKNDKKQHRNSRKKESRKDKREQRLLSQGIINLKRQMVCRGDINRLNAPFLAIFESLSPAEEDKAKQKQLLTLLEKLVSKEWPEARLYLYGSCANSFGVSKSDIDVCLAIYDADINKSKVLLKLADILQSYNLQNVQGMGTTYSVTVDDIKCAYSSIKLKNFVILDPITRRLLLSWYGVFSDIGLTIMIMQILSYLSAQEA